MTDSDIRTTLDQHWAASDANDFELEHQIYREDAVLEYPQSGERIRGRRNIQITRTLQPSRKRFKVRRVVGAGDLWVTEYVILYDGQPSYTVSIMEFEGGGKRNISAIHLKRVLGDRVGSNRWKRSGAFRRNFKTLNPSGAIASPSKLTWMKSARRWPRPR
jgi:hypothetical protein